MRSNRLIGLFLCFAMWSGLSFGQSLRITLYNKTGYDLDSLLFEKRWVGDLRKDSSIVLHSLSTFTIQGMFPLYRPYAHIKGKEHPILLSPCGTRSRKVKSGTYAFDILIYEDEHGYRLYWEKHGQPDVRK